MAFQPSSIKVFLSSLRREWIDFLMPGESGDWIWETQSQTSDGSSGANVVDPLHVDFILVNLIGETSVVSPIDTHFVYRHDEGSFVGNVALSRTKSSAGAPRKAQQQSVKQIIWRLMEIGSTSASGSSDGSCAGSRSAPAGPTSWRRRRLPPDCAWLTSECAGRRCKINPDLS